MSEKEKRPRGKLKKAIAGAAPQLAHALGGPLAGAALATIPRAIFGAPDIDEETLSETLAQASPDHLIALKKAEQDFQLALREASLELQRIDAGGRDSARRRQVNMKDWTPSALGALIILGLFVVLGFMVGRRLPEGRKPNSRSCWALLRQ